MENEPEYYKKVRVGISHGDYNGIGYEVIMKTFQDLRMFDFCIPILYGSSKLASYYKKIIPAINYNFNSIRSVDQAMDNRLNIINIYNEEAKVDMGESTELAGQLAFEALEAATQDLGHGIDVLVTAPINKDNIQSDNFRFPGHTEYLASKFGKGKELMILSSNLMRIAVATGHIPLKEVAPSITQELLLDKLEIFEKSLLIDFGFRKAKIAVLGLNPHAGDNGLLGKEELEVIIPAIEAAKDKGMLVFGPFPADGFFGSGDYQKFDGVLAMYHDQGLLPFKALSFEDGVNFTAGLNIVRTSPDHGTGYNIAGKNLAEPDSFRAALLLAIDIFRKRSEWDDISANPLAFSNFDNVPDASIQDLGVIEDNDLLLP
jgi:4-hydroxythreonine-4-phosphate dehydrogenase